MPGSRRQRLCLMLAAMTVLTAALAGCGKTYLVNQYTLNNRVAGAAQQVKGIRVSSNDVDCPGGVKVQQSLTMTCQISRGCSAVRLAPGRTCPVGALGVDSARVQLRGVNNNKDVVATKVTFYNGSQVVGTVTP